MNRSDQSRVSNICFDEPAPDSSLFFAPDSPVHSEVSTGLWWTGPVCPKVIDHVVDELDSRQSGVDAIVIVGLARYPVAVDEWARWFVRWGRRNPDMDLVVDTGGLTPLRRRRLIQRTQRASILAQDPNPVLQLTEAISHSLRAPLRLLNRIAKTGIVAF